MIDGTLDLGLEISRSVSEMRQIFNPDNLPPKGAKFKVGDLVHYIGNNPIYDEYYLKNYFVVSSVAEEDENSYEYSLSGFPYLLWEFEIEFADYNCSYCGSNNKGKVNCNKCGTSYKSASKQGE